MRIAWIVVFIAVFLWSAIAPKDYFTWVLEVAPAVIGALVDTVCCELVSINISLNPRVIQGNFQIFMLRSL